MSRQRTLEQSRAADAWTQVDQNVRNKEYAGEYKSLARGAIAFIQINGLGQTLAFWRAKGFEAGKPKDNGNAHSALFNHVSQWVLQNLQLGEIKDPHLLEWIVASASPNGYRRATNEAIAYLSWVKRFAEAELPKGKE